MRIVPVMRRCGCAAESSAVRRSDWLAIPGRRRGRRGQRRGAASPSPAGPFPPPTDTDLLTPSISRILSATAFTFTTLLGITFYSCVCVKVKTGVNVVELFARGRSSQTSSPCIMIYHEDIRLSISIIIIAYEVIHLYMYLKHYNMTLLYWTDLAGGIKQISKTPYYFLITE